MKYKILIKYTSTFKKTFYEFYLDENNEEFSTTDLDELNETIKKINETYGNENVRVIVDVDHYINATIDANSRFETVTDDEMTNIYSQAFKSVFGEVE